MFNDQLIQQTGSHETVCAFEEVILNDAALAIRWALKSFMGMC